MSKDRARRRAAREVAAAAEREARARARRRQQRLRRVQRALTPARAGSRRRAATRYGRRTPRERAAVGLAFLAAQAVTWVLTPSWALRGLVLLVSLVAVPAAVVLVLDRSDHR